MLCSFFNYLPNTECCQVATKFWNKRKNKIVKLWTYDHKMNRKTDKGKAREVSLKSDQSYKA